MATDRFGHDMWSLNELVIDLFVKWISHRSSKASLIGGIWRTFGPKTRTDLLGSFRALVHCGWWLTGAALAMYYSERLVDPAAIAAPPK